MTIIGLALSVAANLGINIALRGGGRWGPAVTWFGLAIGLYSGMALVAVVRGAVVSQRGLDLVTAVTLVGTTAGVLAHTLPSPETWGSLTSYCALVVVAAGSAYRSPAIFGVSTFLCLACWMVFGIAFGIQASLFLNLIPVMALSAGLALVFFLSLRHERSVQALLVEKLSLAADRDQLTGLLNRTGFYRRAVMMREAALRARASAWCAFVDIDDFKAINDDFGHERGDAALCEVADALTTLTTGAQIVARWGGDEFVMMGLGDTPPEETLSDGLNTRALSAASTAGLPLVTVGVFACSSADPWTLDGLLAAADSRMYGLRRQRTGLPPRAETAVGRDQ